MPFSQTFSFDESRYKTDHQDLPITIIREKLRELEESESNDEVRVGVLHNMLTTDTASLGTVNTSRHQAIVNAKKTILNEIIRQRERREGASNVPKPTFSPTSGPPQTKTESKGTGVPLQSSPKRFVPPPFPSMRPGAVYSRPMTGSVYPFGTSTWQDPFEIPLYLNSSLETLYAARAQITKKISGMITASKYENLSHVHRLGNAWQMEDEKKKLEVVERMIEDSVELNEEQFRLDLKERSLSSLEALLTRLNARCRQLDLVARLPALPSVRKQNERDAETMMKKCEIVAQAIRDAKALEKEKGESDVQGEGPTFDEDRYRERLKPLGQVDLRQELAVLLKEKEALRKRIQESMSPEERQSAERQLSIADTKRVILLKMINQRVESDEIAFRSQLLNLTLASYPVQKFGGGLLPPIQPKVAAYAPFIEKQYLSQIRYQSSADLQKKSDALEQQSLVLTEEKQSDLSPQRKTEVENQLTIVDRKRAILSKLLREREEAVIRYKSSLAEKAASTSGEKTAVSALDSSEEIVDTDTASYSRSDTKNSVTSGKADMSSETFHDNARPPRSISNPEAYYWSSEALE